MSDDEVGDVAAESRLTEALIEIRAAFGRGDYEEVVTTFGGMGEASKIRSGIRVEAVALAARAHMSLNHKREALNLLKREWARESNSARLCAHLAIACLELREYEQAASLSARAAQLQQKPAQAAAGG